MMNRTIISLLLSVFVLQMNAQQIPKIPKDGYKNTRKGNESFKKQDYASAEKYYQGGIQTDTNKNAAYYNLGNALYKQKKFDEAGQAYANATAGKNSDSLSRTWHNLGNSMIEQKKYQESINAYKQALKLNPNDEETRYNLAYAQSKLKQQQKPQKQNQKNNQQQKNQQQQQQQQQDQQQQDQQKQDQQKDQQQKQNMSKDEAQRMLDALKDDEKKTRDRMNNQKTNRRFSRSKTKDW